MHGDRCRILPSSQGIRLSADENARLAVNTVTGNEGIRVEKGNKGVEEMPTQCLAACNPKGVGGRSGCFVSGKLRENLILLPRQPASRT